MTNKEIKFELAKVALTKCNFMTSESLTESLNNLYEWIMEEPKVEEETVDNNSFGSIGIKEVLNIVRKNHSSGSGIATLLGTAFHKNNISTVDDLVRIGRHDVSKYRLVGKKSIWAIDDALAELGVKGW